MDKFDAIQLLKDFYYCKMECCGCGVPLDVPSLLSNVIRSFEGRYGTKCEDRFNKELLDTFQWDEKDIHSLSGVNNGIFQIILHQLDSAGVILHGSSIYGARLYSYGKELVKAINICVDEDCLDDVFI